MGLEKSFLWYFLLDDSLVSSFGDHTIGKVSLGSENSRVSANIHLNAYRQSVHHT